MPMDRNPAAAAPATHPGRGRAGTVRCAGEGGRLAVMDTANSTAAASLLEQDAVPWVGADEHLVALGHRIRRGQAHDERPAVPVDVVLGEVALEHALADPGGPRVDRRGGTRAPGPQPDGAGGQQRLAARWPSRRGSVNERATGRLDDDDPVALEIRAPPAANEIG